MGYNFLFRVINFIIITSNPLRDKSPLCTRWATPFAHFYFVINTGRWRRKMERYTIKFSVLFTPINYAAFYEYLNWKSKKKLSTELKSTFWRDPDESPVTWYSARARTQIGVGVVKKCEPLTIKKKLDGLVFLRYCCCCNCETEGCSWDRASAFRGEIRLCGVLTRPVLKQRATKHMCFARTILSKEALYLSSRDTSMPSSVHSTDL